MSDIVADLPDDVMDWRQLAACREVDPELFFPSGTAPVVQMQIDQAKAVCHGCLVVERCLGFAMRTHQEEGVWGGLTPRERQQARIALAERIAAERRHHLRAQQADCSSR